MQTFFKYLILIIVMSFIGLTVLDYGYTTIYNKSVRSKFQYFKSFSNKKLDYIFLGSSRVENDLNPLVIDSITGKKSINMGIQGARLKDVFLFLKLIKAYNIKNEAIYVQLDYNFNMQNAKSKFLEYQLIPFVKQNQIIKEYITEKSTLSLYDKIPFIRYSNFDQKIGLRETFSCLMNKKSNINDKRGFAALNAINLNSNYALPITLSKNDILFKSILKYVKEQELNVTFFCSPIRKDTKNLEYIKKLKLIVPGLIDFSNDIQDVKLFKDNLHLNKQGAQYFSEVFGKMLLKENKL